MNPTVCVATTMESQPIEITQLFFSQALNHLRSPIVIMVFRNIVSVLDSFMVRGDLFFSEGLARIEAYYSAMLQFAAEATVPTMLVSYERAASAPERFVDELVDAVGLGPVAYERRADAISMITGDSGGYSPLPGSWHHVEVSEGHDGSDAVAIAMPINDVVGDFPLIASIRTDDMRALLLWIDGPELSDPFWVNLSVDFGKGFDMLNTHHLMISGYHPAIAFRHKGAVIRVAIGARPEVAARIRAIRYTEVSLENSPDGVKRAAGAV